MPLAVSSPVNVEHHAGPAGPDGQVQCIRCKVGLGSLSELQDDNTWTSRPWKEGEMVVEVEDTNSKTFFCADAMGPRVRCVDG